jgi:hypothetical protein
MWIAAPLATIIVINQWKSNTRIDPKPSHPREFMTHTIASERGKGRAIDEPLYRMIQSIDVEALIRQAAEYFRLGESELTRKRGRHRQERALVMELLHRHSGLKQGLIAERFGDLEEGLVSRDRRTIREKIETESKPESGFRISRWWL